MQKILKDALSNGGDFAEIFAEHSETTTIAHENKKLERINTGVDSGYGVRTVKGDHTSYSYTNEPLAGTGIDDRYHRQNEYKHLTEILNSAANTAWNFDGAVKQVQVNLRQNLRHIWIENSEGLLVEDEKKETVLLILVIAEKNGVVQTGYEVVYNDIETALDIAKTASERAVLMLSARPAPRGVMPVVISSSAGGTMVHEAVGHGLEADLADKGMSVYKNKIGKTVASKIVTVIDDATILSKRGTFNFDDEGTKAQRTVLIENGVLKTYMHDKASAKKAGVSSTGNGRRESYRCRPIVRMTNTIIAEGNDEPEAIIRSLSSGLFVKKIGGGQVNTINGDFVFETQESYLIENGRVGELVRGATLIGNGPQVLMEIDMVGKDIGFGLGTCGKEGQGSPVGHGMPTIRIPNITVGGTG